MPFKRKVLLLLSAYDPETHRAAVEAARRYNWHLDANVLTPMTMVGNWRGDGILCSLTDDTRYARFIERSAVPAVDLSTWREDLAMPRVSSDSEAVGRLAAKHFMDFGHRNFAWYASAPTPFGERRFASFESELCKNGRHVTRIDGRGSQLFETVSTRLKELPRPCAILCQHDADAAWLSSLCLESGFQVPMDFAILGVDNNPLICEVQTVPLSSIDRDATGIAFEGARLLQAAMDGGEVATQPVIIPPKGVITRASSDELMIEDDIVRNALRYLRDHLAEKTGTPEVAAELGISRSMLNQRFQIVLQTSVHKSLMQMRLNRAAELLAYTRWSVEQIAAESGFTHASHLSNSFKAHFKQSPLAYRREHATSAEV
ncbi:substrate-binding domain-containing protein [Coraliomargarita akajimensis]|uniref:Transcriptional regulator, AraC family n=1 Tax=Coraliomargarita akajimensis (strain DSM 45221 / IAM 15411 / JCM 23193 / KCTC 12865 / 04OKA010-24) TaxID=583355 RepID=D5ENW5_CORAD|nr:substrate-binding domain-containing protein [Coraliomargarita akajimensis]ADE53624.1 transcriptional regulator, AraC family [Coraliomargarita akajimensis DSM 45221]